MIKRTFDLIVAGLAVVLLAPIMAAIALLLRIYSPGPLLYKGTRIGLHGKPFGIYKFRTMVTNAELIGGPSTALNDPRLTPIGKFLRKYKLDELPQLFNILKGEMSFVGPRPQVEVYTSLYSPEERLMLSVKPGLTDFASIHFINQDAVLGDSNVDEKYLKEVEPVKNALRMKYVRESCFSVDMKILLKTLIHLFKLT